jgi:hypothetical protein
MTLLVRFLTSFLLTLPTLIFAQDFQYSLEGSFTTTSTPTTQPTPLTVNYQVRWNETSTDIQGMYQDNLFAKDGPKLLTGTVSPTGRTFNVILPFDEQGVKSITLTSPQGGLLTGTVPMTVETRNNAGINVDTVPGFALMDSRGGPLGQGPNQNQCTIGFGAISGYCGLYTGTWIENFDSTDRCNLLTAGGLRMELAANTAFTIYMGYIDTTANIPFHALGTFVTAPLSTSISQRRRVCEPLSGTTFTPTTCKTLSLSGIFFEQAGDRAFNGTYSIYDESTGESCSYNLDLRREVIF